MALMIMPFQVGLFAGPLDMTLMIPTIINIISINIIHVVHIDALAFSIFLYQLNQNSILLFNIVSDSCIDFYQFFLYLSGFYSFSISVLYVKWRNYNPHILHHRDCQECPPRCKIRWITRKKKRTKPQFETLSFFCSWSRTWTCDPLINSQML